ncbi:MAG: hypothetical protein ACK56I_33920, partial [bacterium]
HRAAHHRQLRGRLPLEQHLQRGGAHRAPPVAEPQLQGQPRLAHARREEVFHLPRVIALSRRATGRNRESPQSSGDRRRAALRRSWKSSSRVCNLAGLG